MPCVAAARLTRPNSPNMQGITVSLRAGLIFMVATCVCACLGACSSTPAAAPVTSSRSAASPATSLPPQARSSVSDAHDVLARFSGTYVVVSKVTSATGSYGEEVGSVSTYTWHAVPGCASSACYVSTTSSSSSHYRFTYAAGVFHGVGAGTATCFDQTTSQPTGETVSSALTASLKAASTSTPIARMTGSVSLSTPGCGGATGSGRFDYTLTRTGS